MKLGQGWFAIMISFFSEDCISGQHHPTQRTVLKGSGWAEWFFWSFSLWHEFWVELLRRAQSSILKKFPYFPLKSHFWLFKWFLKMDLLSPGCPGSHEISYETTNKRKTFVKGDNWGQLFQICSHWYKKTPFPPKNLLLSLLNGTRCYWNNLPYLKTYSHLHM